jgi:5-methylcytosine-specific restriction endonuclease McrA
MQEPEKPCSRCQLPQRLSAFSRHRGHPDGRASECKRCAGLAHARYRAGHAVQLRTYNSRYYQANRARLLAVERQRWEGKKDAINAKRRAQRAAATPAEKARARLKRQIRYQRGRQVEQARWRVFVVTHPDQRRENHARRRARKRGAPVVETIDRLAIYARDGGKCHLCHRQVSVHRFTLDHLVPLAHGGAHTALNLAVAHRRCNESRGTGFLPAQLRLLD